MKLSFHKLIKPTICPFEISTFSPLEKFSKHCSNHSLMISFGGMLAVVIIQQPSKLLFTYQSPQKNILSISYGQLLVPQTNQNILIENLPIDPLSIENTVNHTSMYNFNSLLIFLFLFFNISFFCFIVVLLFYCIIVLFKLLIKIILL